MRDHEPIIIDKFNGLWTRGRPETTPLDHFTECNNVQYFGMKEFGTRDGVGRHQDVATPVAKILRIYNYPTQTGNTLLILSQNGANGEIYHVVNATTMHGPVLTIAGMTDFALLPYAGRAYISPFTTTVVNGLNQEKGMTGEFLYVYKGDGTAARKAAGPTAAGTITIANGAAGHTDVGRHVFGVVGETDTGYLSPPTALNNFVTGAALSVSFSTIPTFTGSFWTKRHIVASIVIQDFNGDNLGYQLFFIPGATINDNVTTTLANVSFYDADLLLEASHLQSNFTEIAAGSCLCLYHNRLCLAGQFTDPSIIRVSAVGEPEAINQVNGLLIMPPDGNPINNLAELRDVLYGFKRSKTAAWVDNGDVPSSWPYSPVDDALGTGVHGIATHLDSGSTVSDYLIIATYKGLCLFNGRYAFPELSWKIQDDWFAMDRNEWRKIQVLDDPIKQIIYFVKTDRTIMHGNYLNGFDPKNIRWGPWSFDFLVNTIAIWEIDDFIIGADQV